MIRPPTPPFLERETYRRRRLADAARLLPVAGLIAVILPVLWLRPNGQSGVEDLNIAAEALYLFGLWAVLIVLTAVLSRALMATPPPRRPGSEPRSPRPSDRPDGAP